jgi:glutamate racemase
MSEAGQSVSDHPVIGVYDSGAGGLTVMKALAQVLPGASFVYFGDTGRCPYGPKGADTITRYAIESTNFLLEHGADVVVVACNTATAVALDRLTTMFSLPIFGVIEPAVQQATVVTKSGKIGVIGTTRTVTTKSHEIAIKKVLPDADVLSIACPLFVPVVEEGCPTQLILQQLVREYLSPLKAKNVDTLILGCTHYPLIESEIRKEMGEAVSIIDPAYPCALAVSKVLPADCQKPQERSFRFFVSDDPGRFSVLAKTFLGMEMGPVCCVSQGRSWCGSI